MAKEKKLVSGGLVDINVEEIVNTKNIEKDNAEYTLTLHTENIDLEIELPTHIDITRDYNTNVCDYISVTFMLSGGVFTKEVYPYRDNLEMTVSKRYKDNVKPTTSTRYKLVLHIQGGVDASYFSKSTESDLDSSNMMTVTGQLLNREIFGLRDVFVDGVYKNVTMVNLIRGCLAQACGMVELEGNRLSHNIDVYECNNDYNYNNLIIPTGINVLDLPSFLQVKDYGVYNGSIGTYIQKYNDKDMIFVYPLYSTARYEDDLKYPKLTIYHANSTKYDMVDNTYKVDGKDISIVAISTTKSKDLGTNSLIDDGDTIVMSSAEQVLNSNFEVSDDDIQFDRTKQLKGVKAINRTDGQERIRYSNESNGYKQRSHILRNTLAMYSIPWKYSQPEYIYPGMPCVVIFEDSKKGLMKLYGTVQGINSFYDFKLKTQSSLLLVAVTSPNIYKTNEPDKQEAVTGKKDSGGAEATDAVAASGDLSAALTGSAASSNAVSKALGSGSESEGNPELVNALKSKGTSATSETNIKTNTDETTQEGTNGSSNDQSQNGSNQQSDTNGSSTTTPNNGENNNNSNSGSSGNEITEENRYDVRTTPGGHEYIFDRKTMRITFSVNGKPYDYPANREQDLDTWIAAIKEKDQEDPNWNNKPDKEENSDDSSSSNNNTNTNKQPYPDTGTTPNGHKYSVEGFNIYLTVNIPNSPVTGLRKKYPASLPPYPTVAELDSYADMVIKATNDVLEEEFNKQEEQNNTNNDTTNRAPERGTTKTDNLPYYVGDDFKVYVTIDGNNYPLNVISYPPMPTVDELDAAAHDRYMLFIDEYNRKEEEKRQQQEAQARLLTDQSGTYKGYAWRVDGFNYVININGKDKRWNVSNYPTERDLVYGFFDNAIGEAVAEAAEEEWNSQNTKMPLTGTTPVFGYPYTYEGGEDTPNKEIVVIAEGQKIKTGFIHPVMSNDFWAWENVKLRTYLGK